MLACLGVFHAEKGRLGRPSLVQGLSVADLTPDSSRMPPESPFATIFGREGTRATAAGWAENTATLATIDGLGRRQRRSPAPALATRTAAATLATIDGQDSERSPRQPWPPSTGKADASDVHPLRRWPPGRRRQP